jgi:type II secretory pathway pseudopilin PulG
MTLRIRRHPRGFFLTDTIVGIGILVVLSIVLTVAIVQFRKGAARLADSRSAQRLAEQTLLALQSGQATPTAAEGETIDIAPLPAASETRDLPTGCTWVRVRTSHDARAAELIGVVRADVVKGAGK